MNKTYYRFFGGLLNAQEKWLNKMAVRGYRLVEVKKIGYVFEPCPSEQVQYCVEFIGQKSQSSAQDYHDFLEELGYRVFYKNINLNYSIGKVRYRPWADEDGKIATQGTTYNRELLIVEKVNDGKSFQLHTAWADRASYFQCLRNPWLCCFLLAAVLTINQPSLIAVLLTAGTLFPVIVYQWQMMQAKHQAKMTEG